MKKLFLSAVLATATFSNVSANPVTKLDTSEQKTSYSFGIMFGTRINHDVPELDLEVFIQGLRDAVEGNKHLMTDEQIAQTMYEYQLKMQAKMAKSRPMNQSGSSSQVAKDNLEKGNAFLEANKQKQGVTALPSGLQYEVIEMGNGPKPGASDFVTVHYTGKLLDGSVFDSSVERGQPASFPLNRVIPGWTEGLQLMPTGSKWRLFIPSALAYGENGAPGSIGPNETLTFDVELISIQ